jgi:hypothetical protein
MSEELEGIDWSAKTWEGSRRAQLRHALTLSLRERLEAAEGLADVARRFEELRVRGPFKSASAEAPQAAQSAREPLPPYGNAGK